MKSVRRIANALWALCLMLAWGAMAEAEDPVVVRVGGFTYTTGRARR